MCDNTCVEKKFVDEFSRSDLESAQKAISSSVQKIEKVYDTLSKKKPPPKAQLTLATRNLSAMRLALALIKRELKSKE